MLSSTNDHYLKIWIMLGALLAICLGGLNSGAVQVDVLNGLFEQKFSALERTVMWDIRLPRILMTLLTGAGLAICGVVLQAICRNPLADPGLVGVSSGAALFSGLAIMAMSYVQIPSSLNSFFIPLSAFFGAAIALLLLVKIANSPTGIHSIILILAGVAINAGAMTLLGLINYAVDDATLRQITFWSMGSYGGISYTHLLIALGPIVLGSCYFWRIKQPLMLMSCSEKQAKYQGVETETIKSVSLWVVAAMVAVCVSFTGIVGFVGLVVPHVCRMFISSNFSVLLPTSAILGASLVTLADTLARTLIVPAELPIGLITSLVGVPFFLYLILREKRKFAHV